MSDGMPVVVTITKKVKESPGVTTIFFDRSFASDPGQFVMVWLAGIDEIPQVAGGNLAWREELVRKIISLQRPDGSWINDNNRWWENDPVLVTSYSLLALEFACGLTQ